MYQFVVEPPLASLAYSAIYTNMFSCQFAKGNNCNFGFAFLDIETLPEWGRGTCKEKKYVFLEINVNDTVASHEA